MNFPVELTQISQREYVVQTKRYIQSHINSNYDMDIAILREIETARLSTMWRTGSITEGQIDGTVYRYFMLKIKHAYFPLVEFQDQVSGKGMMAFPWDTRFLDIHEANREFLSDTGLLKSALERCGGDFYFPVLRRSQFENPEDLIRNHTGKMQYTSHLLGAKAKRVAWSWQSSYDLSIGDWSDIQRLANQHSDDYRVKQELDIHQIEWDWTIYKSMGSRLSLAVDKEDDDKIIAAMACLEGKKWANSDCIAKSSDDIYKPYALIPCALLSQTIHAFTDGGFDAINLGLNFEPTSYKDFLPIEKVPLMNLPFFPHRASVEEIQQIFEKEANFV